MKKNIFVVSILLVAHISDAVPKHEIREIIREIAVRRCSLCDTNRAETISFVDNCVTNVLAESYPGTSMSETEYSAELDGRRFFVTELPWAIDGQQLLSEASIMRLAKEISRAVPCDPAVEYSRVMADQEHETVESADSIVVITGTSSVFAHLEHLARAMEFHRQYLIKSSAEWIGIYMNGIPDDDRDGFVSRFVGESGISSAESNLLFSASSKVRSCR